MNDPRCEAIAKCIYIPWIGARIAVAEMKEVPCVETSISAQEAVVQKASMGA